MKKNNDMKRFLNLIALIAIILLVGCKEDQNSLTLDKDSLHFSEEGGSQFISLTTDAASWQVVMDEQDWLEVSPRSGNRERAMITFKALGKVAEGKMTSVTIKAGNTEREVSITQEGSEYFYAFSVTAAANEFTEEGGETTITLRGDAPEWSAETSANWLTLSSEKGDCPTEITLTISANESGAVREDSIVFSATLAKRQVIKIVQKDKLFPSYNTNPIAPDNSNMNRTATQLASAMYLGWNLGNSMEVPTGETGWGNAKTTKRLIDSIAATGINAIRIPCAWYNHQERSSEALLSSIWLARVKEVVDYCLTNNMYVVLNAHWDSGWLEENCTKAKEYEVNARQRAFWEQIATYFRDYNEQLLFAGTNEPNVDNATQMSVLLKYEQTFIDAVRSTGGRNSYRTLIVQGPSTDIDKTYSLMKTLPTDSVANRMIAEIHYYTPYHFCLMEKDESWGNMAYFWGNGNHYEGLVDGVNRNASWGEESELRSLFGKMRTQFVNKGIPVIVGEYCATRRSNLPSDVQELHYQSRAYFHQYATQMAKQYGLVPFYWDNGYGSNLASGIFNRATGAVIDQMTLDALLQGAADGNYPY